MPNTLSQPYVQGSQHAISVPLIDPRVIREARYRRFERPDIKELALANSIYVPSGRWPVRGWVLVRRADLNSFSSLYQNNFQLQLDDFADAPFTFGSLSIVQSRCVSRGVAADPNAIYLVELTDRQGILYNPWAQFPTVSEYNIRAPAYPGQYYSSSLNAGTPWTWDALVGDLWGQMGAQLGAYPHLPVTPAGTPEGWGFPGTSCWLALDLVLDYLGLTVSVDLTKTSPYGIVVPGAADARFTALTTRYAGMLEEDLEYVDAGSGRIPGSVTVYFHRRNQYYGTEETIRGDSLQWTSTPLYSVSVSATTAGAPSFANAKGTAYLWSEFTVQYDINNVPLAADVVTANAVAVERANQYYTRQYRGTLGYSRQAYSGALPFYAGSQVDGVRWHFDYSQGRGGWRTELIRGPQPPWPEVEVVMAGM